MTSMRLLTIPRRLTPAFALLIVAACGSAGGAGWTYAPLGPTPLVTPSQSAPPSGSLEPGLPIDVVTTDADPLAFDPAVIEAPAATVVTVTYLNDNALPHNINFFDGPDENSPSLGATAIVTGPGAPESVTFTTPSQPGDFYFWCDVHLGAMAGTLRVTP